MVTSPPSQDTPVSLRAATTLGDFLASDGALETASISAPRGQLAGWPALLCLFFAFRLADHNRRGPECVCAMRSPVVPRHLAQGDVAAGWVRLGLLDLITVVPDNLPGTMFAVTLRHNGVLFGVVLLSAFTVAIRGQGADGTAFGPTVNGLRMSIALINTPEPSLSVTIENAGDIPVLVRVGNGTSAKPDHLTLRGYLTKERGKTRLFVFGSGGGYIFIGNVKSILPFTIPLRPKDHYEIEARLIEWSVEDTSWPWPPLSSQVLAASALRVELDGSDCFAPHDKLLSADWPDPRFSAVMRLASGWECWHGRLNSNMLRLK
jgi:hypothetical protein